MRALRLLVLVLALALAPLHAHADRGNYLRCVAFVPPRGFRVPRPPFPSVALRRSMRAPTRSFGTIRSRTFGAHTRPPRREHRPRHSHDASRATETRAPALVPACPVATDTVSRAEQFLAYHARRWVRHDYYGALNVTRAANATEIAKKYRRLALQYHPDKLVHLPKHEHKRAEATFKEIAEAKEVLSDGETRAAYDETIDGLPRFARPRYGSRSVFDKERLKIGPIAVLLGSFLVVVTFITLNQRANQVSDKASIARSEYYRRWLKRARKAAKEDRHKERAASAKSATEKERENVYFQRFLEQERIVFREGWEYTLLGRWVWRLRGKGEPPKTRAEIAAAAADLRFETEKAEAEKTPASPAKRGKKNR